jgi:hypothetical protein
MRKTRRFLEHGLPFDLEGVFSRFPASWLRVLAPLVAKKHGFHTERAQSLATGRLGPGWLASDVNIPEVSYKDIFSRWKKILI